MEMQFFWIRDKVAQNMYQIAWHPGQENLADYQSKHHIGSHHVAVRSWYLHEKDSPMYLPRAVRPLALWKGVLELSRTGTYEEYPYQEFHKYRAPVLLLVLRFIGI